MKYASQMPSIGALFSKKDEGENIYRAESTISPHLWGDNAHRLEVINHLRRSILLGLVPAVENMLGPTPMMLAVRMNWVDGPDDMNPWKNYKLLTEYYVRVGAPRVYMVNRRPPPGFVMCDRCQGYTDSDRLGRCTVCGTPRFQPAIFIRP